MDTARTASITATGIDAAKAASILRQTETIPLAKLRKQIIAEDYREWKKWEEKQDFAQIMQGRYNTQVTEHQTVLFPDSGMLDKAAIPLKDYWTHRLTTVHKKETPMDLLKVTISKDARINKDKLHTRLDAAELDAGDLLRKVRAPADNLRCALTYTLRPWLRFEVEGMRCSASATQTKKPGLDLRVQVKCVSTDRVEHTEDLCVIRSTTQAEQKAGMLPLITEWRTMPAMFRDLVNELDATRLELFGEDHYFESDLRRLVDGLLEEACLGLWPGLRLILTDEASARVKALERLLGALDAGEVKMHLLSLDNTPANREALARELGEQFVDALDKLTERCGYAAPNLEAISADYVALQAKIELAESVLGVSIPWIDAGMQLEMALAAAQEA